MLSSTLPLILLLSFTASSNSHMEISSEKQSNNSIEVHSNSSSQSVSIIQNENSQSIKVINDLYVLTGIINSKNDSGFNLSNQEIIYPPEKASFFRKDKRIEVGSTITCTGYIKDSKLYVTNIYVIPTPSSSPSETPLTNHSQERLKTIYEVQKQPKTFQSKEIISSKSTTIDDFKPKQKDFPANFLLFLGSILNNLKLS